MHHTRLLRFGIALAAPLTVLLPACDESDADDRSGACFPLPAADHLRVARRPGENDQGRSLQGGRPGESDQGTSLQGGRTSQADGFRRADKENQGTYLGLADLNGARLELAAATIVTLVDGRLVADPRARVDGRFAEEIVVHAPDGRSFVAKVTELEALRGRFLVEVEGRSVCAVGEEGVFVAGHWDDTGAHAIDGDELTYSCMNGVIAKCVDWGYAPWTTDADVHQSCTRLARADYCGDGVPWTLDGTLISVYDGLGVQGRGADARFGFEAAWGVDGAVCVQEMRYVVEDEDGRRFEPACFAELPRCSGLGDAAASGAVIANDSAHTSIDACE